MTHIRVRYAQQGVHVHCSVWSTEGSAETTHGRSGGLVFREEEWVLFHDALVLGGAPDSVEFVEDPTQVGARAR